MQTFSSMKKGFKLAGHLTNILALLSFALLLAGCSENGDNGPQKMSKAEWRQKYAQNFGKNPIVQVTKFKGVFGEPDRSETIDQSAYFYYTCRDGEIQVIANDPNLFQSGACVQRINDY